MKIKKARAKNFFSYGNAFVEVEIDKYKRVILRGQNGEGKSTLLNLITFALFGKTIKKVTKPNVVNSINKKNCLVEVEFEAKGSEYLVRRGIKPNVFEIHKDGELLDQTLVGDYQEFLESEICSYRTFLQTCILSCENYTPFMSLDAASRRAFIEDILDIRVFSVMDKLIKVDVKKVNDELAIVSSDLTRMRDKAEILKSAIEKIETIVEDNSSAIQEELDLAKESLEEAKTALETLQTEHEIVRGGNAEHASIKRSLNERTAQKNELKNAGLKLKTQLETIKGHISFFTDNDNCPTCSQPIEEKNVGGIIRGHQCEHDTKLAELKEIAKKIVEFDSLNQELEDYNTLVSDYNSAVSESNSKVAVATSKVSSLNQQIRTLERKLSEQKQSTDQSSEKEREELEKLKIEVRAKLEIQSQLKTEKDYNTLMLELFKDSGIKSKIVEQYIPVINTMMNQYLDRMEMFISFELDSEFNETLKSRHRDGFTYHNFSAGERQRIDLAIMFTMRRLAAMRNSFECNLFGADEVFDAAVDAEGVECIASILNDPEFDNTNLFIISHRNTDKFEEICDGVYTMKKRDGFSEIHEE